MKFLALVSALAGMSAGHQQHFRGDHMAMVTMGMCMRNCPIKVEKCKEMGLPINPGRQIESGACMTTPIGALPPGHNKPFSLIIGPEPSEEIPLQTPFAVRVKIGNFDLETPKSGKTHYQLEPQVMNKHRFLTGHSHVAIQFLGDLTLPVGGVPLSVPHAKDVEFFAPFVDDRKSGVAVVSFPVGRGLSRRGWYRICTFLGNNSHGPIYTRDNVFSVSSGLNAVVHQIQTWPGDCIRVKVLPMEETGMDLPFDPAQKFSGTPQIPVHTPARPIPGFWRG